LDFDGGKNSMGLGCSGYLRTHAKVLECEEGKGLNPRDERDKVKVEQKAAKAHSITFEKAAKEFIKTNRASWKNEKHAQQWENTLDTYAYPKIGKVPCAEVTKDQVLSILKPIWTEKHETATRLRLSWAIAKGSSSFERAAYKDNLQPAYDQQAQAN
jgi:hypothetical protein